jgi:hypothetical protein
LPVESVIAGLGLHFLLPTASWPIGLALVWKIVLYCFLAVLIKAAAGGVARIWRANPAGNAARMTAACIAGCIAPFVILSMGHYWAAGKGLSMAAPLLFLLVTTPLLAKPDPVNMGLVGRLASFTFAFAHLALGLLRPILVTEFAGAGLPGRRVAIDLRVPWASARLLWKDRSRPYFPEGWENFACVVSSSSITAKPGVKLIWVNKDRSILEFLEGQLAVLEVGAKFVAGVSSRGVYGVESYEEGALQWTSQVAQFEAPNNPAAPSRGLRLELWPMPLSGGTLKITVNGDTVFNGTIPSDAVTMSLDRFVGQDKLTIALLTNAVTHYPNDPRELGVAIKELRLSK